MFVVRSFPFVKTRYQCFILIYFKQVWPTIIVNMSGILAMFVLLCSATLAHSEPQEKCLDGQYHKASPEPQGASYKACEPWQNKSCCTANFTVELVNNQTQTLYNHSWHRCGKLSDKCEKFWVEQVRLSPPTVCSSLLQIRQCLCSQVAISKVFNIRTTISPSSYVSKPKPDPYHPHKSLSSFSCVCVCLGGGGGGGHQACVVFSQTPPLPPHHLMSLLRHPHAPPPPKHDTCKLW